MTNQVSPDARHSRSVAEAAREKEWRGESFMRDLFLGNYRLDLFESQELTEPTGSEFLTFYRALHDFLEREVDPVVIDAEGEYPRSVIEGLRELGAFGMKIPRSYGGLGFTHAEYVRVMELLGSHDGNITALLSAHQAIGVPQPIKLFGTEEQKRRFLPRCARGAISAFALTEPAVGSDPARIETEAKRSEDGSHYVIHGQKLWCTNGTLAELLVVMARDASTGRINAFVVETDSPGVTIDARCHFMGLRALANAYIHFDHVIVPRENLIGNEGDGLKIALVTLNTGRLTLPAATAGLAKRCTEIVRKWGSARVQWGEPIGKHEAIAHINAEIAGTTLAMEALAMATAEFADRQGFDIRLEAAAAKEWNTARAWEIVNRTLQVRGGRGFETEQSLANRGEAAVGVERMLRDARVNLIFEGSSEIMHLFMAREAVDKHLTVAGVLVDPDASVWARLLALPRIALFYLGWFAGLCLPTGAWPRFARHGALSGQLRYAERACRRLARCVFYGMLRHRAALERRQAFLFRAVDIAMELFALTAVVFRARALQARSDAPHTATELAQLFASQSRQRIERSFLELFHNDDERNTVAGHALLDGRYLWLEQGAVPLPYSETELTPKTMADILATHAQRHQPPASAPATSPV